ncbi:fork head domain-containing protein [Massariosphaeria phaeospora]|uniref:Fork head domain-containing protein n=1 Tax=Massariosphaeria phaeospora TaxID=100035 RepID=A0A7C8MDB4_9PLEO|nr:fork head domain-containing protein [Massariosphaeria phaeospora]
MRPSSTRSGLRSRREPDMQQQSDADTPESIATPTRKRRRVHALDPEHSRRTQLTRIQLNGAGQSTPAVLDTTPPVRITESAVSNDDNNDDNDDNDDNITIVNGADAEDPVDPVDRQNMIIASLRTPQTYTPNAAYDYANDLQAKNLAGNNIAAFAKIAARDWCFFVQKTVLVIGRADSVVRPNRPASSQDVSGLPHSEDALTEWGVDIDLGPERQVSRVHAQVDFNSDDQKWYITVNSRNGLKLDDRSLPKGERACLHSGVCIGIMGTQMIFLLDNQEDVFHQMLWRQMKSDKIDSEVNDSDNGGGPSRLPHAHPSGPTPKREHYDPFPPSSHPRNKPSSQASNNQLTSTPGRQPNTPLAFRSTEKGSRSKGSPAMYSRGMMMDSTEEIDYSQDSAKDLKPPHSYAQLIGQAILSSPEEMLTLAHIYHFIKTKYAFFRHTNAGWQNSIRHNLSLSKTFEKVARRTDEPGKGMKWRIADRERAEFVKKQLLNPRKAGGPVKLTTSGPSSPALRDPPSQATERLVGALDQHDVFRKREANGRIKSPPRSATPPLSSVPMANESYTPDRGPRGHAPLGILKQSPKLRDQDRFLTPAKRLFHDTQDPRESNLLKSAELADSRHLESSPPGDPVKPNVSGLRSGAANSPPPLFSDTAANGANGGLDANRMNNAGLVTPLVPRNAPRLAPPSTAQVPSQYMNFSSPAPFWKYCDLPSTPARASLADVSPIKLKRPDEADKDGEDELPQPSSPPILGDENPSAEPDDQDDEENKGEEDEDMMGPESPSRTMSRPGSRRELADPQRSRSNSNLNTFRPATVNGGMVRGASLGSFEEEPEEESFDLSKGFEKIGSFHKTLAQSAGVSSQSR